MIKKQKIVKLILINFKIFYDTKSDVININTNL